MPLKGISDFQAFSKQSPDTTREARNMRSQDPTNGRVRMAQRSGMSRANSSTLVMGSKVAELAQVVFDNRAVTFDFTAGAESTEWSNAVPSEAASTLRGTVDDQGNVYALDGNSAIVKLNPDGVVVWQFPLPTKDEEDIVRFLHVDELGDIYAGVSAGRRQDLGRIWKLTQLPEDKVEIAWTQEINAYVERGKVRQDKLYTAQNEPDTKTSYVRVYDALDAAEPLLTQEFLVAYPVNGMDIKEDGSIVTCHENDGTEGTGSVEVFQRGPNPKFPNTTPVLVDWTPFDLPDWQQRLWRWQAPEDIGEFDVSGNLDDFAKVLRWEDRSGNGRHLFANTAGGDTAPSYIKRAHAIWPGVRFNGTTDAMRTEANPSVTEAFADQQKTLFPAYAGSMFTAFIVCRPENAATARAVLHQEVISETDHTLIANEDSAAGASAGDIRHLAAFDAGDTGAGTGGNVLEGSFDNVNDLAIVTIQYDGAVEAADSAVTRSHLKINGRVVDRYEGEVNTTLVRSLIGSDGTTYLLGDILEIIVLDRRDRTDDDETNYAGGVVSTLVGGGKILSHETHPDIPAADQSDTEETRIEGYLHHKYGVAHLLPGSSDTLTHPFANVDGNSDYNPGPPPDGAASAYALIGSSHNLVAKWTPAGKLVWSINSFVQADQDNDASADRVNGLGGDVIVNSDGNIYSVGARSTFFAGSEEIVDVCLLIDEGDTVSADESDGAWGVAAAPTATAYNLPQIAIDKFDNLYVPISNTTNTLRVYSPTGTLLSDVTLTGREATAIAVDPNIPDYEGDLTDDLARFVYAFTDDGGTAGDPTVYKVRLVTQTATAGTPRTFALLGIAGNGGIRTFAVDGGAPAEPTGASGALAATAPYYRAQAIQGEIVMTDGVSDLQVYDPRDDDVTLLESTASGRPPHGCRILEKWNDRLFAARAPGLLNEAFNWQFSKKGDLRNYDNFPPDRDPSAAIGGANLVGPGMARDIINGFVPFSDDVALFLCDHSAWWLTGDPGDGGEWDLLSDEWGGAFGRAWAKDPDGNAYVFGSRGGLYKVHAGGGWERLTLGNIERRLRNVDLAANYIRMAWNDDDEGIHIFQMPFGAPSGSVLTHWFWDTKVVAPWEDVIGNASDTGPQPTAVLNHDADAADDRVLLIGGEDGFVRRWDRDAKDDDMVAIDARVLIGSLASSDVTQEMRYVGPRVVLADEQDGASYELFSSDEPTVPGVAMHTGGLGPGRNPMMRTRVRGSYVFLRILNASMNQRFAIEEASVMAFRAGRKRVRTAD